MTTTETRDSLVTSRLIQRIERVDLRVRDVETSLRFYRDVVGLAVTDGGREHAALGSAAAEPFLSLRSAGVTGTADARSTGLFHVAIRFPDRAALGDALARLVASGLPLAAADHAVSEALYVDDPDGNGVELYWDRPAAGWPAPEPGALVPMVTLPVDLQDLLGAARDPAAVGGAAPAGTDVGHVHLQVADVERTVAFYSGALGLDLTARMGGEAAFFSSNGYHHHLGANSWRSRGGTAAGPERAGLERVVFAVAGAGAVERLRLRLVEHGHEVSGDEGRAVEVRDPDGVEVCFQVR